ncbi:hypothetical protein [Kocuria flava]|uniref:hypothetical protein n=1 Tax=Kocuria flava TaxID=446860 RepID=UPI0015DE20CC|nr:hypothetical protein [Kocuria flava]
MDGNYKGYNYISSSTRIAEILDQPTGQFEETDDLPHRDRLTYTNGFYGNCSAVFVDIRDSSSSPKNIRGPSWRSCIGVHLGDGGRHEQL